MTYIYSLEEQAALTRVMRSGAPQDWKGDPEEVLLAARARERVAEMVPGASHCAVLAITLDDGVDDPDGEVRADVARRYGRVIAEGEAALLDGATPRTFHLWQRLPTESLDGICGRERKWGKRATARCRVDVAVPVWRPNSDWVRTVTGGLVDG